MGSYPGGKGGSGVSETIINQMPAHEVFISTHLGRCAVMRRMRPAARSIGVDSDVQALELWTGDERPGLELWNVDAVEFLRHFFGLYRLGWQPFTVLPAAERPAVVFSDPPYMRGARSDPGRIYRHEMSDEQHAELLDVLLAVGTFANVLICGYWTDLYTQKLAEWRVVEYESTDRAGRKRAEFLWCNFPEPDGVDLELHDYRYIGTGKRAHEMYAKRARTLRGKFERATGLERGFYLQALNDYLA